MPSVVAAAAPKERSSPLASEKPSVPSPLSVTVRPETPAPSISALRSAALVTSEEMVTVAAVEPPTMMSSA